MKQPLLVAVALAASGALAWFILRDDPRGPAPDTQDTASGPEPFADAAPTPSGVQPALPGDEATLLAELRERFASRIADKHAQIKLIEQLIRYARQHGGDDWRALLKSLLQKLFPELADEIYARFEKLEAHNRWLTENRHALSNMSAAQRREALWAARYAAFGAEAEEIWAGARRAEALQDTLASLDAGGGTSAQKLERFVAAIETAYGAQAPLFIEQRRTELLGSFLAVKSVQQELRALPDAARNARLRELRAGFGMDEDALTRWEALDRERDAAWAAGQRYMAERAAILAVGAPEQQAQQLEALRLRTFGADEAAIIRSEEEAGFYRFGGERRIGRE